jgi:hypothetical protein
MAETSTPGGSTPPAGTSETPPAGGTTSVVEGTTAAGTTSTSAGTPAPGGDTKAGEGTAATGDPGKTEGTGAAGEGDTAGAQDATSKVPDKYELKVPEGGAVHVDATDLAAVEALARKNGWSQEDAQAYLDEHVAGAAALSERFRQETLADPDYGGEKLAATQRLTKQLIDRIRPEGHPRRESFLKLLNRGGYGNNLDVVAFMADVAKLMGEDTGAGSGRSGEGAKRTAAEILYDNPTSQPRS